MYKIIFLLFILLPFNLYANKIPGLNINIYNRITGLWTEPNSNYNFSNCYNCGIIEYGWGKSMTFINGLTIIDPIKNEFQFAGLHLLRIKSLKEIKPDVIDIELFFINGTIQRYRIKVLKPELISIVDNGSTDKYTNLSTNYKRIGGPDFRNRKYGKINGTSVRIREKPNINSKIIDIIPNGDRIISVLKSNEIDNINGDKYYWYKIVSDSGYTGWVYGKYIQFDNF